MKLDEQVFHVTRDNKFIFVSFSIQFFKLLLHLITTIVSGHAISCHYTLLIQQAKHLQLHCDSKTTIFFTDHIFIYDIAKYKDNTLINKVVISEPKFQLIFNLSSH